MDWELHSQNENIRWFDKSPDHAQAHNLHLITKESTWLEQIERVVTRQVPLNLLCILQGNIWAM